MARCKFPFHVQYSGSDDQPKEAFLRRQCPQLVPATAAEHGVLVVERGIRVSV